MQVRESSRIRVMDSIGDSKFRHPSPTNFLASEDAAFPASPACPRK